MGTAAEGKKRNLVMSDRDFWEDVLPVVAQADEETPAQAYEGLASVADARATWIKHLGIACAIVVLAAHGIVDELSVAGISADREYVAAIGLGYATAAWFGFVSAQVKHAVFERYFKHLLECQEPPGRVRLLLRFPRAYETRQFLVQMIVFPRLWPDVRQSIPVLLSGLGASIIASGLVGLWALTLAGLWNSAEDASSRAVTQLAIVAHAALILQMSLFHRGSRKKRRYSIRQNPASGE